jgi:hypothetical protein
MKEKERLIIHELVHVIEPTESSPLSRPYCSR